MDFFNLEGRESIEDIEDVEEELSQESRYFYLSVALFFACIAGVLKMFSLPGVNLFLWFTFSFLVPCIYKVFIKKIFKYIYTKFDDGLEIYPCLTLGISFLIFALLGVIFNSDPEIYICGSMGIIFVLFEVGAIALKKIKNQ